MGLFYEFLFKKLSDNWPAFSVSLQEENKWPTYPIMHSYAKFPKYRKFGSNENISKRFYIKTRRGIIVITPWLSLLSQRLHMLFWLQTMGQILHKVSIEVTEPKETRPFCQKSTESLTEYNTDLRLSFGNVVVHSPKEEQTIEYISPPSNWSKCHP